MSLDSIKRDFEKKLKATIEECKAKNSEDPLIALRKEQEVKQSKVNLKPYSDPDDRYEGFANDYGEFLYKWYGEAIRKCSHARDNLHINDK